MFCLSLHTISSNYTNPSKFGHLMVPPSQSKYSKVFMYSEIFPSIVQVLALSSLMAVIESAFNVNSVWPASNVSNLFNGDKFKVLILQPYTFNVRRQSIVSVFNT